MASDRAKKLKRLEPCVIDGQAVLMAPDADGLYVRADEAEAALATQAEDVRRWIDKYNRADEELGVMDERIAELEEDRADIYDRAQLEMAGWKLKDSHSRAIEQAADALADAGQSLMYGRTRRKMESFNSALAAYRTATNARAAGERRAERSTARYLPADGDCPVHRTPERQETT